MTKKNLLFILIGLILVAGIVFVIYSNYGGGNEDTSGIILFYGRGCPHCANVDEYIKDNGVEDKIQLSEKEVFSLWHRKNAKLLGSLASSCGLPAEEIGVPFLWNGASSTCIVGDQDIINFFKEKIGG